MQPRGGEKKKYPSQLSSKNARNPFTGGIRAIDDRGGKC